MVIAPRTLLISNKSDFSLDWVVQRLRLEGIRFFRLNTEDLDAQAWSIEPNGPWRLGRDKGVEVRLDSAVSVLWRRPLPPRLAGIGIGEARLLRGQWQAVLDGLQALPIGVWVNDPWAASRAESKVLQLNKAQATGLAVPRTLITNVKRDALAFAKDIGVPIVCKALNAPVLLERSIQSFVFTSPVRVEDLATMEDVEAGPLIVQEAITPKVDVRITVVGDTVHSASTTSASMDWRQDPNARFEAHQLPNEIAMKAIQLSRALGLRFAGIDLALDRRGTYWFLELNPTGEWGWLESIGLPIARSLVRELKAEA